MWVETAPPGYVTEFAVTLGIFDDDDVAPTVVFGVIYPYPDCDLNALMLEMAVELLKAARKEYGRKIPKHAAFWQGSTREVPDDPQEDALPAVAGESEDSDRDIVGYSVDPPRPTSMGKILPRRAEDRN
jgi:hypothetical protein